jgi:hypothetical protein
MAFQLTNCKEVALRAFIVEWAKEKNVYCNRCGDVPLLNPYTNKYEQCCEKPQLGTNAELLRGLIAQNELIKNEIMGKETGANKDNTFRWGISITPRLLHDLEQYSLTTLGEPLFKDPKEMNDFMGSFPEFRVCKKI